MSPPSFPPTCFRRCYGQHLLGRKMLMKNNQDCSSDPRRMFIVTLLSVFLIELIIMFFLQRLPELSLVSQAFLDAGLLAIFVTPILYGFFLKPFQVNVHLRRQAETAQGLIREENCLKSEFISMAAHELRTPLTTIMGYSELLLTEDHFDGAKKREFADIIHQKSSAMDRLIDDLLDLSHIETGQGLGVRKEHNDIFATLSLLVSDYRQLYPQRPFTVKLPGTPCCFAYDKMRIDQVFDNILSNAIKFSPPESLIEIEGILQPKHIQFQIRDRGIGMSQGELSRVFEKFYRAGISTASPPGLGLGMAIVKAIVTSHGGEIWLESHPGAGTTASFTLPTV